MKEFIPINLTRIGNNYESLLNNKFNIILGSPGSGKTCLAKYLEKLFPKSRYFTVQDFMDEEKNELLERIEEILILDGFDEYRLFESSKTQVIRNFARKIRKLLRKKEFKIILTCRELDWYGDNDTQALKDILNIKIEEPFYIESLNEKLLQEFIENYDIPNEEKEKLIKLYEKGLVKTPQLFQIAINVLDEEINNKIELFEKFITKAVEEKNMYHKEKTIYISNEKIFNYLGYMAYFYMFSKIESFGEEIISEIASNKYEINIIRQLLNTKIFRNNTFMHRTVAEFLCGKFFANKIEKKELDKILIIDKFKNKNFIYTELRVTYAWLCALTADRELIEIDPFYQLVYGENNHFSIEFKKGIILAIKKYTEKNPYFFDSDTYYLKNELEGFYIEDEEFDEFLIKEFDEAISMKNHYIYLFEIIFTSNMSRLSNKLKKYLFEKMFDNNLKITVKNKFLKSGLFSTEKIKNILEAIKNNKIQDNDNLLKITILEILYSELSDDKIVELFKYFEPTNMMHICWFLYDLDFDRKKELVLKLEKEVFLNIRNNYEEILRKFTCLEKFLENFYYELFHTKDVDEIYNFLKQVRKFYKDYEPIKVDKGYLNKSIKGRKEEELQKLSNELFEKYFNDFKFDKGIFRLIYEFNQWFPLAYPSNVSEVIISKIKQIEDENVKKELFWTAMQHFKNKDKFDEVFLELSKELGLENEYKKFKNPQKSEFEMKQEKIDKEIAEKKQKEIEKNNEFFANLSKEKFLKHFGALDFFSYLILFEEENIEYYISVDIFNKFKNYLKDFIFSGNFIEYISIEKFSENLKENRKVDTVFYTSLCLNKNNENLLANLDDEIKQYLYLLSVKENNVINICHNEWFIEKIENENSELAKKAITKLLETKYNLSDLTRDRINDSELSKLKELYNLILYSDSFVDAYIKVFNFDISREEIDDLKNTENTKLLKVFEKFYNNRLLNEQELVVFYVNIFDGFSKISKNIFEKIDTKTRLKIIKNFLLVFDDDSKMPFKDGVQNDLDITRSFVRDSILNMLENNEIEDLLKEDISEYWKNLLKWKLSKNESNNDYKMFKIRELKDFVEQRGFLTEKDFFRYISLKMNSLIERIEANENNQKDLFWDGDNPKNENKCRDAFVNLLNKEDKYLIIREEYIGNNRADFTINSKFNEWKIRVECKKDNHTELFNAIETQLIGQYLHKKLANYGIYLVFYFGERKKTIDYIKNKILENVPIEWKDNVKIKIIDLRKE